MTLVENSVISAESSRQSSASSPIHGEECRPEGTAGMDGSVGQNSCLQAVLDLADRGIPVFPCDPGNKRPLVAYGFKTATTVRSILETWWRQWPTAMIGVPTGEPSGAFVLDIDKDEEKGLDG